MAIFDCLYERCQGRAYQVEVPQLYREVWKLLGSQLEVRMEYIDVILIV